MDGIIGNKKEETDRRLSETAVPFISFSTGPSRVSVWFNFVLQSVIRPC